MTPEESDELSALIVDLFKASPPNPELLFHCRQQFIESGVLQSTARALIVRHRAASKWFEPSELLAEIDSITNTSAAAKERMKSAAQASAARRAAAEKERQEREAEDKRRREYITSLPADVCDAVAKRVVEALPENSRAFFAGKDPKTHPLLAALVCNRLREERAGAA